MKKIVNLVIVLAFVFAMCLPIYAEAPEKSEETLVDLGYSESDLDDSIIIVIRDANGKIVKTDIVRAVYVNGTQETIPAGGSITTYQYYTSQSFFAGFYYFHSTYGNPATTTDRLLQISIRNATSVGGTRNTVTFKTFSTNLSIGMLDPDYNTNTYGGYVVLYANADSTRPYMDAVYTNLSSSSMVVSMMVGKD